MATARTGSGVCAVTSAARHGKATELLVLRGGDRDRADGPADAVQRGRAFLEAGAACVFVPARWTNPRWPRSSTASGAMGRVINVPGSLPPAGWPSSGWPASPTARGSSAPR